MAISDDIQRIMPTARDRTGGQVLNYREAVLLKNPSNPSLKGEVDDKYQYSCNKKDSLVHGWISTERDIGFWVITPSNEFRVGGPVKNDLTSHVGPTSLAVFFSGHYAGPDFGIRLRNGEPWKKVFGPVFIYLNSGSSNKPSTLWEDAKEQMQKETQMWPYDFPSSEDYPQANQRGTITGRLLVRDRYLGREIMPAKSA
ncbi:rhamnogalacturonate lyase B-like [Olea europaea subsp. europaea]|uniref:Rhamnogalacturonate lyase B-like n=1 Tax=Olea europaea subsp. europaea TaxID=158383 RepID=A0A8S0R1X7_OLEEU|nr:rhamnogalacturonate lyase B-like [Olea europaea subsp. europaea]